MAVMSSINHPRTHVELLLSCYRQQEGSEILQAIMSEHNHRQQQHYRHRFQPLCYVFKVNSSPLLPLYSATVSPQPAECG